MRVPVKPFIQRQIILILCFTFLCRTELSLLKSVAAEHPLIIIDIAWAFQVFNSLFAHHSTRTLSEQSQVYLSRHLAMDTEDLSSQQQLSIRISLHSK